MDYTLWNLGDVCFIEDEVLKDLEILGNNQPLSKNAKRRANFLKTLPQINNIGVVVFCESSCLVRWQNGKLTPKTQNSNEQNGDNNEEEWIRSHDLIEVDFEDFEFFPHDEVIKIDGNYSSFLKNIKKNNNNNNNNDDSDEKNGEEENEYKKMSGSIVGIVLSVDVHGEVCNVKWKNLADNYAEIGIEYNIPVYHLKIQEEFLNFTGMSSYKTPSC